MSQYTGLVHLVLTIMGVIIYQGYTFYQEKALINSIFLCLQNGIVEELGSNLIYNEYIISRGSFYFVVHEYKFIDEKDLIVKVYHNNSLVYEKSSWDLFGVSCKQIPQKIKEKLHLKVA